MDGAEPSRQDLLRKAQRLGIEHPENMTRVELAQAIAQLDENAAPKTTGTRAGSWLEIARQLLAAVVEQGLNMPDAAALIRGDAKLSEPPKAQPPLATVTLAKIYAAQGHVARALSVLAEVLKTEPDHPAALDLQAKIKNKSSAEAPRRKASASVGLREPAAQTASATASETTQPAAVSEPSDPALETSEAAAQQSADQSDSKDEQVSPLQLAGEENSLVLLVREAVPAQLNWQLAKQTEAARLAGSSVEIEWLTLTPSWRGPIAHRVRIPVTHPVGRIAAPKAAPVALSHAVLGLRQGAKWAPLAVMVVAEATLGSAEPSISRGHAASREVAARVASQPGTSPAP
jgi:hypothetical protein